MFKYSLLSCLIRLSYIIVYVKSLNKSFVPMSVLKGKSESAMYISLLSLQSVNVAYSPSIFDTV